jgi:peptide/nickel transport system permease protein
MSSATAAPEASAAGLASSRLSSALAWLGSARSKVGVALVGFVLLLALVGPLAAPHAPDAVVGIPFSSPSGKFLLGTDYLGHDVLSRVLWGGRTVVWMSFAAATLGVALGVAVGLLAGYSRSLVDDVLMRVMDVLLAFPQVVFVLLFVSLLGPKLWLIVLLIALSWMPQVARVARGVTLGVVDREFVQAAEAIGLRRRRILTREILPNVTTPLLVEYGLRLTWSIAIVAAISFLGFGIQPPNANWGLMINENRQGLLLQPWPVVVPGLCIALFAIGTNFVAEGISRAISGVDRARRFR